MNKRLLGAALGGFVVGTVAFAAGFFGPIILAPEANQGPLLGIFITGPLGTLVGLVAGALLGPKLMNRWQAQSRR